MEEAVNLLIGVGSERPSPRLAVRVAKLQEDAGEWSSAIDWWREAAEHGGDEAVVSCLERAALIARVRLEDATLAVKLYRESFKRGSRMPSVLLDLFKLLGAEEPELRFEVLARLIDVSETTEDKDRFRGWYVILSDGLSRHLEEAFVYLMAIELEGAFDANVINAGYRISTRLDRQNDFRQRLQALAVEFAEISPEQGDIFQGLGEVRLESISVLMEQLNRIESPSEFRDWLERAAGLVDIQMVPMIEWFADTRCADHRNLQLWFYEKALNICLSHTDADILPASWRTHLSLLQRQPNSGETLLLRAQQFGLRFPDARHAALVLAGYAFQRQDDARKALECFSSAQELRPLSRTATRAQRRLLQVLGRNQDLRMSLVDEISRLPSGLRRDLKVELALEKESTGDLDGAESLYVDVIGASPGWLPATYGLGSLFDRQGRWAELATLLAEERVHAGIRNLRLTNRLAELYEFHLERLDEAAELYRQILVERPVAPDAVMGLERVYRRQGKFADLVALLVEQAKYYKGTPSQAFMLYRAGEIAEFHCADSHWATQLYRETAELSDLPSAHYALEYVLLQSHDTDQLRALYYSVGEDGHLDELALKRSLFYVGADAFESVDGLITQSDGCGLIAWLYSQMTAEIMRNRTVEDGLLPVLDLWEDQIERDIFRFALAFDRFKTLSGAEAQGLLDDFESSSAGFLVSWREALCSLWRIDQDDVLWTHSGPLLEGSFVEPSAREALACFRVLYPYLMGKPFQIEDVLARASDLDSEWLDYLRVLVTDLGSIRSIEDAELRLTVVEKLGATPEAASIAFEAGLFLESQGQVTRAIQAFEWSYSSDAQHLASLERLVSFLGDGVELSGLFELLMSASDSSVSDAHRSAALRLLLANNPYPGEHPQIEAQVFEALRRVGGLKEYAVRYGQMLISDGAYEVAKSIVSEALSELVDDDDVFEAQLLLGEVELLLGNPRSAIEAFRQSVTLKSVYESLSALAFAYLTSQEYDLAQLTYDILRTRGENIEATTEGVIGKIVSLASLGRMGASEKLFSELESIELHPRALEILGVADESLRREVLTGITKAHEHADKVSIPNEESPRVIRKTAGWMEPQNNLAPNTDNLQVRKAWQLQRQSWHRSVLLTTPRLIRRAQVINRGLRESLMPEGLHPALVDTLTLFSTLNDPFAKKSSLSPAPLSSAELARLQALADALASPAPLVFLDNDNPFRLDCRAGATPAMVIGEALFDSLSIDQTEFLAAWCLAIARHGAMPPTFMRAYRRFGPRELDDAITWIESTALGGGTTSGGALWTGAKEFKTHMVEVMEWSTSDAVQEIDSVYRALQEYGLRIAVSAVASYPVAMETIRLIDLDDRPLSNLSSPEIKESVSNSVQLSAIDAYASMEECIKVRSELFSLAGGDE